MGAILSIKCPHCLADKIAMRIVASAPAENYLERHAYLQCPDCLMPVCANLRCEDVKDAPKDWVTNEEGDKEERLVFPKEGSPLRRGWAVEATWPLPPAPRIPEHLPASVHKAFAGAEVTFGHRGLEEQTAGGYGRALDIGTKIIAQQQPDAGRYERQMMGKRLSMLADANLITSDLRDWGHKIASVRNGALHDIESIDREELKAIRGFTEMLLRYLFTLPGMLKERKEAAKSGLSKTGSLSNQEGQ